MDDLDDLLILRGRDVTRLLSDKKAEIVKTVGEAYCAHYLGHSCLPHSVFVRFPGRDKERIIALPGYLGGAYDVAGMKWIASFPKNVEMGLSRASAIIVLNSMKTGRPQVVLEGSTISAMRTAASAALAADVLHVKRGIDVLGVVGCGLINREIVRFIRCVRPNVEQIVLYDLDADRATKFRDDLAKDSVNIAIERCTSVEQVLSASSVVSFATTAIEATVSDISMCRPGATVLHISLRDLAPEAILAADNVVDDIDHVMRAQTSLHVTEAKVGHREFVRCALAEIILGKQPPRVDEKAVTIFNPFGLGILDLALAKLAVGYAQTSRDGISVADFFADT